MKGNEKMQDLIITNKGQELISKMIAGTSTATFTRIETSDYDYSTETLETLTELYDVKQSALISKVTRTDKTIVEVLAALNNSDLDTGYYVKALGLYAKGIDDIEILYAVSIDTVNPDYMPAFAGKTVSGISFRLNTKVDNASQVILEINPAAVPTIEQIKEIQVTLATHVNKSINSEEGIHGLRYYNKTLQIYDEKERWTDIANTYKKMTVNIDLSNSNPETCITYADDAVEMTAGSAAWDDFFGHYPVLFKNGEEVGKLNPNDFTKFEDGTVADITSGDAGDVMIAFPRRGLKIISTGNILTISMTDNPDNSEFEYNAHTRGENHKEVFYLGAYGGCYDNDYVKMRSLSGKNLVGNMDTISEFRTMAQANGAGYDINGFYQLVFRQCMYLLKYKNLNSQETIGYGYTNYSGRAYSGGTETWGMDCENIRQTNPSYLKDQVHHVKLFGIEDFWGNAEELMDGLFVNSEFEILTANDKFNDTGNGYINNGSVAMNETIASALISKVTGTTKTGFIIKKGDGSTTTYFCDASNFKNSCICACGGYSTFTMNAGAFALDFMAVNNTRSVLTGSRLMYL